MSKVKEYWEMTPLQAIRILAELYRADKITQDIQETIYECTEIDFKEQDEIFERIANLFDEIKPNLPYPESVVEILTENI